MSCIAIVQWASQASCTLCIDCKGFHLWTEGILEWLYALQLNPLNLRELAHFKGFKNNRKNPTHSNLPTHSSLGENFQTENSLTSQWAELTEEVLDQRQCFNAGSCLPQLLVGTILLYKQQHSLQGAYGALPQSAPLPSQESQLLLAKSQALRGTCKSVLDLLKSWRRW